MPGLSSSAVKVVGYVPVNFIFLLGLMLSLTCSVTAQDSLSPKEDRLQQVRQQVKAVGSDYQNKFQDRSNFNRQLRLFSLIHASYQRASDYISRGVDTAGLELELQLTEKRMKRAMFGVIDSPPEIISARDISASSVLIREMQAQNQKFHDRITNYFGQLQSLRDDIDSLITDSLLFYVPQDSLLQKEYISRLQLLDRQYSLTDTAIDDDIRKMRELYGRSELQQLQLNTYAETLAHMRASLSHNIWKREVNNIYEKQPVSATSSFNKLAEVIAYSRIKSVNLLKYYVRNHVPAVIYFLLTVIAFCVYLYILHRNINRAMPGSNFQQRYLSMRNPLVSGLFMGLVLSQFYFYFPPFIFYGLFWIANSILLTILFRGFISRHWMRFWTLFNLLFVVAGALNNVLQASRYEQWIMIGVAVSGILLVLYTLRPSEVKLLREKRLVFFLYLFLLFEALALISLFLGRYNLGKAYFASGFFGLVVGIQLLWAVRFFGEIFTLSAEAFRDKEKRRFTIDFAQINNDASPYLYAALVIGWLVLIGKSFYIYQQVTDPIYRFFTVSRTLGSYTFNYSNFLLFVFILLVSTLVSRIVSYFADGQQKRSRENPHIRGGLGSWILLVRISIIVIGVFLAFAASGVPMDKITIVLGALSVGIGFGLQNLVNNLVSGLIIAFEKPINVGDQVRIGQHEGLMKSIGFRSSIIKLADGSDVIIPNGQLLNEHLVNYDLSDLHRRAELIMQIGYQTDVDATIEIIRDIVTSEPHVLEKPAPDVLLKDFGNNSLELKILFWVSLPHSYYKARSNIMQRLLKQFKAEGIDMPYQQLVLRYMEQPPKEDSGR